VTLAVLLTAPFATRRMLVDETDGTSATHAGPRARPTAALVPLGVLAFCVLFQEGAMADWTAVYLRDVAGTGAGLAAAGYAGFSITMATGRAVGDHLMARLGPARLVRFGGVAAAVGAALAVLAPAPATAVVGFACIGAGLASAFPAVLAASSRTPGVAPGAGIAFVSMLGYTGFLAGPPLIGFVAEAATLRAGIAVVAGAGVLVALLAGALGRVTTPRPASGSSGSVAPAPAPSGTR
jgi:fucose permease